MPEIGEIKRGREIGYKATNGNMRYIWASCLICGKERWVQMRLGKPVHEFCQSCGAKQGNPPGDKSNSWKGGKFKSVNGYVYIFLLPNDFYYLMANKAGYVLEHRLVVAKSLGRCLQSWEWVHHKNGIRDDNRYPENLELTLCGNHMRQHSKGYQDGYAQGLKDGRDKQIQELKVLIEEQMKQIKLLQWKAKEGLVG